MIELKNLRQYVNKINVVKFALASDIFNSFDKNIISHLKIRDFYLSAEESKEYGLIDEVIKTKE